ncbi:MAG TPA: GNAT family N-acetyltransferase [Bryobacteraceae bacterium]|nr:GNAT family N-acetyltransferase [Bryobacteraceae bacterium]
MLPKLDSAGAELSVERGATVFRIGDSFFAREATADDLDTITEIWLDGAALAFGEDGPDLSDLDGIRDQLLKLIRQQSADFKFWLCIDCNGTIAGWCTVQPFHTTPFQKIREAYGLISAYMGRAWRGRGLGVLFLEFVIGYCRARTNLTYIFGFQDRSNTASVRAFERVGFTEFGKLPNIAGFAPISMIICTAEAPKSKDEA